MLLADEQYADSAGPLVSSTTISTVVGETFWTLTDHLGSVRDVVDNNGVVRQHVAYDSYGNRINEIDRNAAGTVISSSDPAAIDELFGYTGRDWDSDVELQNNRARWYDPQQGRWLSNDPIGFAAGDPNLYRYVGNQVTTLTDPSGLDWLDPIRGNLNELRRIRLQVRNGFHYVIRPGIFWAGNLAKTQVFDAASEMYDKTVSDLSYAGDYLAGQTEKQLAAAEARRQSDYFVMRCLQAYDDAGSPGMDVAMPAGSGRIGSIFRGSSSFARLGVRNLRILGLSKVKLAGQGFNTGRKSLEESGFLLSRTTPTGRKVFINPATGAEVYFDSGKALASGQKAHWHIKDKAGQCYNRSGRLVGSDEISGHIPAQ